MIKMEAMSKDWIDLDTLKTTTFIVQRETQELRQVLLAVGDKLWQVGV